MSHPRQAIRSAVVAQLMGKTAAGDHVAKTRGVPYRERDLPAIGVYTSEETSEATDLECDLARKVTVAIRITVESTEDLDDVADALALEVENAIEADTTLGGTALGATLTGTVIGTDPDRARPVGAAILTYEVEYHTAAPASP